MAAEPQWQEILRFRLAERNTKESAYAHIIEQYRRLAQQTKVLKERNASLLRAVGTVRANPSSSNANVVSSGEDNPVRAAYITSLESQISSLRDELAALYKTQNQNAQRLLAMNETLREKEESSRIENETLRRTKEDLLALQKKIEFHNELISEKDRTAQILHDEISTLQLELGQVEERNQILTKDNAKLLQRWLDAKQAEVQKMNAANEFYEEMRTHKQMAVNWQDGQEAAARGGAAALADAMDDDLTINSGRAAPTSGSLAPPQSGNGEAGEGATATGVKDGMRSPMRKGASLTPNG